MKMQSRTSADYRPIDAKKKSGLCGPPFLFRVLIVV